MCKQRKTKRKENPSIFRYSVNLDEEQNLIFRQRFEKSGVGNMSRFIAMMLLEKEMKVLVTDKSRLEYSIRLSHYYRQFQLIGNNYNQTVRAIKTNFGEKRAVILLHRLEKLNGELMALCEQIIDLTERFNNDR